MDIKWGPFNINIWSQPSDLTQSPLWNLQHSRSWAYQWGWMCLNDICVFYYWEIYNVSRMSILWTHMCAYRYLMSSNVVLPTHVVVGWLKDNDMVSFDMLDVIENWQNKHPSTYTWIYWDTYTMDLAFRKGDEIRHWIIFSKCIAFICWKFLEACQS